MWFSWWTPVETIKLLVRQGWQWQKAVEQESTLHASKGRKCVQEESTSEERPTQWARPNSSDLVAENPHTTSDDNDDGLPFWNLDKRWVIFSWEYQTNILTYLSGSLGLYECRRPVPCFICSVPSQCTCWLPWHLLNWRWSHRTKRMYTHTCRGTLEGYWLQVYVSYFTEASWKADLPIWKCSQQLTSERRPLYMVLVQPRWGT